MSCWCEGSPASGRWRDPGRATERDRDRKPRFVCSAYLSTALRPHLADYTANRYNELFDRAELMFSLIVADQMVQHQVYAEPWLGLFVDAVSDSPSFERSWPGTYLAEAAERVATGTEWPPLRAGMFGGSPDRFKAADPVPAAVLIAPATAQGLRRSVLRMFRSHPWIFLRGNISGQSADLVNTPDA
jgi:hypothetical protein